MKVYEAAKPVSLDARIDLGGSTQVVLHRISEEWNSTVFVTREARRPPWAKVDLLEEVNYELFIVYWNREHNLLFVCASARSEHTYEKLANILLGSMATDT